MKLGEHEVALVLWVSDHWGIEGNKITDQLAKLDLSIHLQNLNQYRACQKQAAKWADKHLGNRRQHNGESTDGQKRAKSFLQGPFMRKTRTLICKEESTETYHGTTYHHFKGTPVHTGTSKQYLQRTYVTVKV
jgi:hypothetical protein